VININDVYYQYDPEGIDVLCGVSLEIREGEHVALIGPNGCGKTTLIQHLNALLLPDRGTVTIDGLSTSNEGNHIKIRSLVGMVFQNPENQIIGMTVEEDVAFGPENLRLPSPVIKERVAEALNRVGILDLAKRNIEHLSGGEKRLVAIAGVLAIRPHYIVLDEPTAFLDPAAAWRVLEIIDKLSIKNIGIIHITHNMDEAAKAQKIVVLNEGQVSMTGIPQDIFTKVEVLREMGMQLPQVTELLIRLKKDGFPVRSDIVDMENAVEQIKLLAKTR
jgi:energy-coupling factor transporter ATPase